MWILILLWINRFKIHEGLRKIHHAYPPHTYTKKIIPNINDYCYFPVCSTFQLILFFFMLSKNKNLFCFVVKRGIRNSICPIKIPILLWYLYTNTLRYSINSEWKKKYIIRPNQISFGLKLFRFLNVFELIWIFSKIIKIKKKSYARQSTFFFYFS